MKQTLLLIALVAVGFSSSAQTFVSTDPENRNVVLEEYTGIYCTFCPDGHKRAQQLKDANPNDVILSNIHVGGYAAPTGGDPDFRTSFGTALDNAAGTCGYPAGSVNREAFAGYLQTDNNGNPCGAVTAQSRGNWATTAAIVLGQPSAVNVAGRATLDLSTRQLTVVVEAYYTANSATTSNKLTVAVLQNKVEGPQTGSAANPTQVLPNGNYLHNHMLRHFLTGQWGANVTPATQGSFFTDTYTWDIPASINGVPVDLANLEVAVWMAEGNQDIISGSMVPLTVISPNSYDALPAEIDVPDFVCEDEVAPKVTIQNMGNETMTSLTILYSVNGGPAYTYNWTGSLQTAASAVVTLPSVNFTHLPENTVWVATSSPNGQSDELTTNDIATKTFAPTKNSETTVDLEIKTDNYGYETYWEIRNPSGAVVASGGNTTVGPNGGGAQNAAAGNPGAYANNTTINETVNLSGTGCHTFHIVDDYGDGICCQYGQGSFKISSGGVILYTGGQYGNQDDRTFNVGGTSSIDDLELVSGLSVFPNPFNETATVSFDLTGNAVVSLEVFSVLGAKVYARDLGQRAAGSHTATISADGLNAGIYMVNLMVDGSVHSTRISITK